MKRIPLRKRDGTIRAYALVDDADFVRPEIGGKRWSLSDGYAVRFVSRDSRADRKTSKIYLHRLVMGATTKEVDHRDGDTLNNQRRNLRYPATRSENMQNVALSKASTSGHRGVTWSARRDKWVAQIMVHGRTLYLGQFAVKADAVKARDAARVLHPYDERRDKAS